MYPDDLYVATAAIQGVGSGAGTQGRLHRDAEPCLAVSPRNHERLHRYASAGCLPGGGR